MVRRQDPFADGHQMVYSSVFLASKSTSEKVFVRLWAMMQ